MRCKEKMKFHHVAISVRNAEKSATFYKENFGFREVNRFTKPDWDGSTIVLKLGNVQIEIFQFMENRVNKDDFSNLKVIGLKHMGIQVESVNKKYKELKKRGIDIDKPTKGVTCAWFCFLRDPDGISIELYEPKLRLAYAAKISQMVKGKHLSRKDFDKELTEYNTKKKEIKKQKKYL